VAVPSVNPDQNRIIKTGAFSRPGNVTDARSEGDGTPESLSSTTVQVR
jgi:hypothetical protein